MAAALLACLLLVPDYLRGGAFVARAARLEEGVAGQLSRWDVQAVREQALTLPTRHGPLRARLYQPAQPVGPVVLLTPGVHAEGIDEPRLTRLAKDLAVGGRPVLTPELPDLLHYRITPRLPDLLEDAAVWAAGQPHLAPEGRVGLVGISFSGGLSVVAAGRPALREKVAFTLSLGGHGELSRVLSFLCTGTQSDGQRRAPHDYGLAVLLLNLADALVPPEQVAPLREGLHTFLRASHLALHSPREAEATFALARQQQTRLPEPAATLMGYVNSRDVSALGPLLLPHVPAFAREPSLSPERSPPPPGPVYLLHGEEDNVVPALESTLLARHLEGRAEVVHLRTPLLSHASLDQDAGTADVLRLVAFWAELLSL